MIIDFELSLGTVNLEINKLGLIKMSTSKVSAITVSLNFRNRLRDAFAQKFGKSPQDLRLALNKEFAHLVQGHGDLIGDKTIRKFFNTETPIPIYEKNLNFLCKVLLGYDSYIQSLQSIEGDLEQEFLSTDGIDIWGEWLDPYRRKIVKNCGTVHVLEMPKPLNLKDVFVPVYFWKNIRRRRQKNYSELIAAELREEPKNTLASKTFEKNDQKRYLGLEEIKSTPHLLIYGDGGSGKTLLLKWLSIRYLDPQKSQDDFGKVYLPIFIRFKHLSESIAKSNLVKVALDRFENMPNSSSIVLEKLEKGECIILLDAVDEAGDLIDEVCEKIDRFVETYPNNRIIITCREAATDHKFSGLTEVEMASFNPDQVSTFVYNWNRASKANFEYAGDPVAFEKQLKDFSDKFLSDLDNDPQTKELSSRPLLLTYLCMVFRENYGFPKSKSSIFADVVDILLRRWDASRQIKRRLNEENNKLSPTQKINLLGEIAYEGMKKISTQFVWKESQLNDQIRRYLLKVSALDENDISINTNAILELIIRDTGLLFEIARGIYAFPYPSLQEYLAAEYIVRKSSVDHNLMSLTIKKYFTNQQWSQIFIMIFERIPEADELFRIVWHYINALSSDYEIQRILDWLNNTTISCGVSNCGWRIMTLTIDIYTSLFLDVGSVEPIRRFAEDLSINLRNFNLTRRSAIPNTPKARLVLDHLSVLLKLTQEILEPSGIKLLKANDFILSRLNLTKILESYNKKNEVPEVEIFLEIIKTKLQDSIEHAGLANLPELESGLIKLSQNFPTEDFVSKMHNWSNELNELVFTYLKIGHRHQLTEKSYDLLNKYIYANYLLLECILSDNFSDASLRYRIADLMFLPVSMNNSEDLLPCHMHE